MCAAFPRRGTHHTPKQPQPALIATQSSPPEYVLSSTTTSRELSGSNPSVLGESSGASTATRETRTPSQS
jgi:hypothetical protein